jgi:hypothetical protein
LRIGAPLSSIGHSLPALRDQHGVIGESHHGAALQHLLDRILDRAPSPLVDDVEHLFAVAADGVPHRPAGEVLGHRIHELDVAVDVGGDDGVADALERPLVTLALLGQRLLGSPLLGLVVEHEDHPENRAGLVANGRGTVGDRVFRAIAAHEDRGVRHPDDVPATHDQCRRILDPFAGLLAEDVEDLGQWLALRGRHGPAGQPLGGAVEERDESLGIGGDHRVADAAERDPKPLLLRPQRPFRAPDLGDVAGDLGDADDLAVRSPYRRDRQRHVDPSAVLRDAHGVEVLDALASPDPRQDFRLLMLKLGRIRIVTGLPISSACRYPKIRSHAGLHERTTPSRSLATMASSED